MSKIHNGSIRLHCLHTYTSVPGQDCKRDTKYAVCIAYTQKLIEKQYTKLSTTKVQVPKWREPILKLIWKVFSGAFDVRYHHWDTIWPNEEEIWLPEPHIMSETGCETMVLTQNGAKWGVPCSASASTRCLANLYWTNTIPPDRRHPILNETYSDSINC